VYYIFNKCVHRILKQFVYYVYYIFNKYIIYLISVCTQDPEAVCVLCILYI